MKNILQYPKFLLLLCSFALAYVLFDQGFFHGITIALNQRGYTATFLGGLLFSFGFTTPFAIGFFVEVAHEVNPFVAAPLAGIGAFLADLIIFEIVRNAFFEDELHRFRTTRIFRFFYRALHHRGLTERLRTYILWSFAGIIIASPLPDEIGVSLLSGVTDIEERKFGVICYVFNTLGIFAMLMAARAIG